MSSDHWLRSQFWFENVGHIEAPANPCIQEFKPISRPLPCVMLGIGTPDTSTRQTFVEGQELYDEIMRVTSPCSEETLNSFIVLLLITYFENDGGRP